MAVPGGEGGRGGEKLLCNNVGSEKTEEALEKIQFKRRSMTLTLII